MPGTRPEFLFFPRATPRLHRCNQGPWGCSGARDILGLSGPRPTRLLAPSLIDFRGKTGIRALYQAIGIPCTRQSESQDGGCSDFVLKTNRTKSEETEQIGTNRNKSNRNKSRKNRRLGAQIGTNRRKRGEIGTNRGDSHLPTPVGILMSDYNHLGISVTWLRKLGGAGHWTEPIKGYNARAHWLTHGSLQQCLRG